MTPPLTFRRLRTADAAVVARTVRAAFGANPPLDPPASALRERAVGVRAVLASGGGGAALFAGVVMVACVLWQEKAGGLYVSRVSVLPRHRRRGLANALLAAAEEEARDRRLPHLWLSTRLALTGNRAVFAACGFREASLHAHPGYARPTYVDMVKDLT
jgi:ribosomal protein S18 acetylase RimI-like enzyme